MAKHIKPGDKVMVILDSAHTKEHVAKELELYSPFVTPGNYLIVNDTYLSTYAPAWDQAGAMQAMREFVANNKKFVIDEAFNRFVIATAPDGFLKRVEQASAALERRIFRHDCLGRAQPIDGGADNAARIAGALADWV
jgi:Cephalosporin hydroxylase